VALSVLAGGCFGQTTQCLETPVSEDVGQVATDRCNRAMGSNLDNQELFEHYMAILRVQGRFVDIIAWSQRVLENDAQRWDALYHLAVGLRKDGQCEAAIARYRQFALNKPDEADPYFGMGLCFEEIGDRLAAVQAYSSYIKKENRSGQEVWVEKARARVAALDGGEAPKGKDPDVPVEPPAPVDKPEPEPTELEPADAEPGAPVLATPTPAPDPAPEPAPAKDPEPAPEPAPEPEPAPDPAPRPAPTPGPVPANCDKDLASIKKDPFDLSAYEGYARCALARKEYKPLLLKLKVGLRDNPSFDKGWYYMGEAHAGLGDAAQAGFAYAKACKKGVNEACSKF